MQTLHNKETARFVVLKTFNNAINS